MKRREGLSKEIKIRWLSARDGLLWCVSPTDDEVLLVDARGARGKYCSAGVS